MGAAFLQMIRFEERAWLRLPVALLSGIAIACTSAVLVLVFGGGTQALKILSLVLLLSGICGGAACLRASETSLWVRQIRREPWLAGIIAVSLGLNLLIALAPSTKIDEIRYHMLIPKRIVEDDGLRAYREPWEASIVPQTQYEIGQSLTSVWGWTDAPNIISWGMWVALTLLLAGAATQLARSTSVGLLVAGLAGVGLHSAVNDVSAGSQALGDLAMMIAIVLSLQPLQRSDTAHRLSRFAVLAVACAIAASTKLSIVPVCVFISAFAFCGRNSYRRLSRVSVTLAAWILCFAPLIIWSILKTGSPFGSATASLFHSMFFGPETLGKLASTRTLNHRGFAYLAHATIITFESYSPAVIAGICLTLSALASQKIRPLSIALVLQSILLAFILPANLRFMGGLQIAALLGAIPVLMNSERARSWLARPITLAMLLSVPWLAIEARYAAIFIPVTLGMESQEAFLRHTVPLFADFGALDRLLPEDAVIFAPRGSIGSIYAPRPIDFAVLDLQPSRPVFLLEMGRKRITTPLICGDPIYENDRAVTGAFRTRRPTYGVVRVLPCITAQGLAVTTSR